MFKSKAHSKRQQSALEFIVTYAWVLIIIAVFLGVIFLASYLNRPSTYLPASCNIQPSFPCAQSILSYNSVATPKFTIIFTNDLGTGMLFTANSMNVTVTSGPGSSATSHYLGNCTPTFAPTGTPVICRAEIPNITAQSGTEFSTSFGISYQVCSGASSSTCAAQSYTSTGSSVQTLQELSYNL